MEKEISNGAMLGIVLIALAAIIGLGFGVFAIAKGTANEGVTGVQENLQTVSDSAYTDFDQKIVTGTQVTSAYNNFNGKNVAILIATTATKDRTTGGTDTTAYSGIKDGPGVDASYQGKKIPAVKAYAARNDTTKPREATTPYYMTNSQGRELQTALFVNYNALLAKKDGTVGAIGTNPNGEIYFDGNCFRATGGYITVGGKVQFNNISGNMSKSGMMEYISSGARFQAYLIKDDSGTILGMAFEQIGSGK